MTTSMAARERGHNEWVEGLKQENATLKTRVAELEGENERLRVRLEAAEKLTWKVVDVLTPTVGAG